MGRAKIMYRMIGTCPRCNRECIRPAVCDAAACDCENPPIEVPLEPVIFLPSRLYRKLQKAAAEAGVTVERLIYEIGLMGIAKLKERAHCAQIK